MPKVRTIWSDPEGSRNQGFEDSSEILNIFYKFLIYLKSLAEFLMIFALEKQSGKKVNVKGYSNQDNTGSIQSRLSADIHVLNDRSDCLISGI